MRRARAGAQGVVIFGMRVTVQDQRAHRGAAGHAVHHAADDLRPVRFFALRGKGRVSGRAPLQKGGDLRFVQPDAGRNAVDHDADGFGMRLTKHGHFEFVTKTTRHEPVLRISDSL